MFVAKGAFGIFELLPWYEVRVWTRLAENQTVSNPKVNDKSHCLIVLLSGVPTEPALLNALCRRAHSLVNAEVV